ncbi:2-C-methyl-D-erythritol 4-phosphate cytidylyltransferase [Pedobacter aquatilis]|uniref:2-C-methyl-D-erythritol 4-phosphate cytidylyltransferase n=1 Tax=Pedobacter aquatilis TaxID=351343 RepID=UPI0025B4C697|nr:2-C-methyl-D-erythritol 4-phosphate cytidylyltransferase [Pedobacter aquatilis]MDN3585346.1 2-C-methyl-D-erythritol 4-phosphate cytidylyltransferase [Pedobacter aquatilis]
MKYYAVIVAGGAGNRMQTETPKQFLLLNNLPVLMHTIKAFALSDFQPKILVVLNQQQHSYWNKLCQEFNFNIPHDVIAGGSERFHSVKNAIDKISETSVISIHDAVRPIISKHLIDKGFKYALENGSAIAAVKPIDSIRKQVGENTKAENRDDYFMVQTPQVFQSETIKKAYNLPFKNHFTDDASVVEESGIEVNLIEGERNNIKITYPADLDIAEWFLNKNAL